MARMKSKKRILSFLIVFDILDENLDTDRPPRGPTRKWIKRSKLLGAYAILSKELAYEDTAAYCEWMRMPFAQFKEMLALIEPRIARQPTMLQEPISAAERLTIAIRFIATDETFRSLQFQFRRSRSAISYIVIECCLAIYELLGATSLNVPSSEEEWLAISSVFEKRWNFPNCLGAVDGKHIVIQKPHGAVSEFYNYKGTQSFVLMAVAGPSYKILYADVGTKGSSRASDGGTWNKSSFHEAVKSNQLGIPGPKVLPQRDKPLPYVFTADDAFALKNYIMKPFPQSNLDVLKRVYNYR